MKTIASNGANMPALGFGTFRMSEQEVADVLPAALKVGFRHVDTAQVYENEAAVGAVLKASGIPRDEIFLTTKVWVTEFAADRFQASVDESLRKLQVDHVDLLLLHWPGGSDVPREVQIDELNRSVERGLVRHIGISNYTAAQTEEAVRLSAAPLATNQVEYHPWLSQAPVMEAARGHGLSLTAYFAMADGRSAIDPTLRMIGERHGKTAAQVALRWLVQQDDVAVLSKTAKVERLAENFAIFDFALSDQEMSDIAGMAVADGRIVSPPEVAPDWD